MLERGGPIEDRVPAVNDFWRGRQGLERGMDRAARRGASDRFEREALEFFERVRGAYLARAKAFPDRFVVIDADGTPGAVWSAIEAVLVERLTS